VGRTRRMIKPQNLRLSARMILPGVKTCEGLLSNAAALKSSSAKMVGNSLTLWYIGLPAKLGTFPKYRVPSHQPISRCYLKSPGRSYSIVVASPAILAQNTTYSFDNFDTANGVKVHVEPALAPKKTSKSKRQPGPSPIPTSKTECAIDVFERTAGFNFRCRRVPPRLYHRQRTNRQLRDRVGEAQRS
jgi:hypothetical protein